MKDAYDILFKKYPKIDFFNDSIEAIIFIKQDLVKPQWEEQKKKIFNNEELFIRGYGRDAKGTELFQRLYINLFDNKNIKKDATNNAKPTDLISKLTGLSKSKEDGDNIERIQNYQISHLFGMTKNPLLFTAAWNIAYIPKYLDPFTGHESQGNHKKEFKEIFDKKLKNLFEFYINDYNEFVNANITPLLERKLEETRKELRITKRDFEKFKKDATEELSIINI